MLQSKIAMAAPREEAEDRAFADNGCELQGAESKGLGG